MLHNAVVPNLPRPNMVKYRVVVDRGGKYSLRVLYASAEERAVSINVNDVEVAASALRPTTGGWNNQHRRWSEPINVSLGAGENTLMLRRGNAFPHLSKFELKEVP